MQTKKPKVKSFLSAEVGKIKSILRKHKLHTVCEEAFCPNIGDCFSRKTATFMIMGDRCTRSCGYCNVSHDRPLPLDENEPYSIAKVVKELSLRYVVITSVNRDDLPDGGASHFAKVVQAVREENPDCKVEVLIPDFLGDLNALRTVVSSKPDVINHNIETVPSLFPVVRHRGDYNRSLEVINHIKLFDSGIVSKSGIMVGLGETLEEIVSVMEDLREVNCEVLTVGQYLQPSKNHHPVKKYYTPQEFKKLEEIGYSLGFKAVFSGALVRSSFHAEEVFTQISV
ncbi:MAG: lipoyl synthase [Aquificae bacterium]|nr:lipoyl synthase [Aquificota bacterium]